MKVYVTEVKLAFLESDDRAALIEEITNHSQPKAYSDPKAALDAALKEAVHELMEVYDEEEDQTDLPRFRDILFIRNNHAVVHAQLTEWNGWTAAVYVHELEVQ